MGNRSSRRDSYLPQSGPSRDAAYLQDIGGGSRTSVQSQNSSNDTSDSVDGEVLEMLKAENMLGIADKLRRFSTRIHGVDDGMSLTVEALATFDRADFDGSGLTPLQRRRLVRAAERTSRNRQRNPGRGRSDDRGRNGATRTSTCVDEIRFSFDPSRRSSSSVDAPLTSNKRKFSSGVDAVPALIAEEEKDEIDYMKTRLPMSPPDSSDLAPGYLEVLSPIAEPPSDDGTYIEFVSDRRLSKDEEKPENDASYEMLCGSASGAAIIEEASVERNANDDEETSGRPPTLPPKTSSNQGAAKRDVSLKSGSNKYSPVRFVLVMLNENPNDPDALFSSCKTIGSLAKQSGENAREAYDGNVVAMITDVLRLHSSVETLIAQGLKALVRICYAVPDAVGDIVQGGEIEGILDLMAMHPNNAAVQIAACNLIYSLTYRDLNSRKALMKFGAIKSILDLLNNLSQDPQALMSAYCALACLSAQMYNAKTAIAESGGHVAIAVGMNEFLQNAQLQMYGCAAIANIAFGNCLSEENVTEDGLLQLVIGVIKEHKDNPNVLLYAMKALGSLIDSNDAWRYVFDSGIISVVMDACSAHPLQADLHSWSCYVLNSISVNGTGTLRSQLMAMSIVDWCLRIMGFHSEETESYGASNNLLHGFPPYNLFSMKQNRDQ